jgi:mono/diheme cytochrome c family protein
MKRLLLPIGLVLLVLGALTVRGGKVEAADGVITGVVRDASGPVSGATVRVQTTTTATVTDSDGCFTLSGLTAGEPVTLTAWSPGYFIVGGEAYLPGAEDVELTLVAHATEDNADDDWLPSLYHAGQEEHQGCAECHSNERTALSFTLPVDEWLLDAHSQSAITPRFLTMYNGADVHGNQSPLTRIACLPNYGCYPLPPDPTQPYYGPGYKLDFPTTSGNCAACHTPVAAVNVPYGVDPNTVEGVGAEGVACDFCHKVWDVRLDDTDMPYENMPGVLSFEFRRPPEGHQFFAGPYDDVAPGEDTYSPLQTESQFCAPCHFGAFWGTVIYNSFGEWLESAYNDPESGQTCQDCHMPPLGAPRFTRPDQGGLARDPATIFSHRMPGAMDEELLQNAVTMTATVEQKSSSIVVQVDVTNDQTGHHAPTDSPLRHLILLVQAANDGGDPLTQLAGPTVPKWGGVGDPEQGYYAGQPGTAFAKILEETWTEISPSGAYWNPTRVLSDNRLAAFATPNTGTITVEVTLLFRRAFIELVDQKDWDVSDILMEEASVTLSVQPWRRVFLPVVTRGADKP